MAIKLEPLESGQRRIGRYGWKPDLPDHRDFAYAAPHATLAALPAKIDLRAQCPKVVYDQGQLGSCTANAIAGAIEFAQIKQGVPKFHAIASLHLLQRAGDGEHFPFGRQRRANPRRC